MMTLTSRPWTPSPSRPCRLPHRLLRLPHTQRASRKRRSRLRWGATNHRRMGKHMGWAPVSPAPVCSESEVESGEGCTDLHKRKNRWIAHIFHSGWDVGRIQDDKAPRGHKYEDQYQVRYPSDGSTYFHVLHPAQYGPDRSWVYIEQPPLVRHAIRPADRRVLRSGKPSGR